MPAFRNRLERLERAFAGDRNYTDDQWDGILLVLLSQSMPEHMVAILRTAPIYPWASQWYVKRMEERRQWSDEQLQDAESLDWPDYLWDGVLNRYVAAWNRQMPLVPCPFKVVDGELRAVQSGPQDLQSTEPL